MKRQTKNFGFTLSEVTVVVAVAAILVGLSVPAAKKIAESFESGAGIKSLIGAALDNARAMAIREQKYAGLRFQQNSAGNQYMIFIIHDPAPTNPNPANGFYAVPGRNPIRLPKNVGVMDLKLVTRVSNPGASPTITDISIDQDSLINTPAEITETTTFSIVFSSAGKLVLQPVHVLNKDGAWDGTGVDDVFNTKANVDNPKINNGMFYEDSYSYWGDGLGEESSRNSFIIYDKTVLKSVSSNRRWSGYLMAVGKVYINPYTGEIIN